MTGLKSGSGDDLWGDDGDEPAADADTRDAGESGDSEQTGEPNDRRPGDSDPVAEPAEKSTPDATGGAGPDTDASTNSGTSSSKNQPYVIRRAIEDKSVQFERDERLTFFVHDDVVEGERDLVTDVQATLGRDVPKFDVREAVYRAALQNPDDVLDELLAMGYSVDEE